MNRLRDMTDRCTFVDLHAATVVDSAKVYAHLGASSVSYGIVTKLTAYDRLLRFDIYDIKV